MKCGHLWMIGLAAAALSLGVGCQGVLDDEEGGEELGTVAQAMEETDNGEWRRWEMPMDGFSWSKPYGVPNPGLGSSSSTCFPGNTLGELNHAGADWGGSSSSKVYAVGHGEVVYAEYVNYPGSVVVIEHELNDVEKTFVAGEPDVIYSQYGHITSLTVEVGDIVEPGQEIGTLLYQTYETADGGEGNNTHLHWEIRNTLDPMLCSKGIYGPGYTDVAPSAHGYLNPQQTVLQLQCRCSVAAGETPDLPGLPGGGEDNSTCSSQTLGRSVPAGTCVQVDYASNSCGPACSWFACRNGGWVCTSDLDSCEDTIGHASCGGEQPPMEQPPMEQPPMEQPQQGGGEQSPTEEPTPRNGTPAQQPQPAACNSAPGAPLDLSWLAALGLIGLARRRKR